MWTLGEEHVEDEEVIFAETWRAIFFLAYFFILTTREMREYGSKNIYIYTMHMLAEGIAQVKGKAASSWASRPQWQWVHVII